ncbi:beta-1,6-N-acetylglucosaminyltransferase [Ovoidimarina sediminis]|uniref:beta-1,6-N-acetylglucosaminyltransferase n=1 Tax=Ovoidimarina sediminis TaxID=3079856 RepID=UPI002915B2E5|nr:beta-1,6-N-acetylglucosaminyltransferase [Rhodophyticola sp. MJ-SS7]MDU8945528.1 beta-1,6-N-acetylglucosaminyltransferase [Rhodophyticola sp. MJ-SS7]
MEIAFIVVAHDRPNHLARLLESLSTLPARTFLHIDKKSRIEDFDLSSATNLELAKDRVSVHWGEWSQVEAEVELLRQALLSGDVDFDYFILLSGSDYPISSKETILKTLSDPDRPLFIECEEVPSAAAPRKLVARYHIKTHDSSLIRYAAKVWRRFGETRPGYSAMFRKWPFFKGSAWWALPRDAAEYLVEQYDCQTSLTKFCRNVLIPDEVFPHTVLMNSQFGDRIRSYSLTYADWRIEGPHPATITDAHLDFLLPGGEQPQTKSRHQEPRSLFARKFPDDSAALVKRIKSKFL